MKTVNAIAVALYACFVASSFAQTPGTGFSYQGRLESNGGPTNGTHDIRFSLWFDAADPDPSYQLGTPLCKDGVAVEAGLFTTQLDFGPHAFAGFPLWLQIEVRVDATPGNCGGGGAFTMLTPRQPLTPTPYALYAVKAGPSPLAVPCTIEANTGIQGMLDLEHTGTGTALAGIFRVRSTVNNSRAITGIATGATGQTYGVYGDSNSSFGVGVCGESSGDAGVVGLNQATPGGDGVRGESTGIGGRGVYGLASAVTGNSIGVVGHVLSPSGYAGYFIGEQNYFSGKVGIGTLSPDADLHIVSSSTPSIRLDDTSLSGRSYQIGVESVDASLRFIDTTGGNRLVITSDGNVGIGTVAPGYRLDVNGRARVRQGTNSSAGIYFFQTSVLEDRGFVGMANNNQIGLYGTEGAGWGLLMDVTNGRVGLGTASPSQRLDVAGSARLTGGLYFGAAVVSPDGFSDNVLSFGDPGVGEDYMAYAEGEFWFQDSPGGGDTSSPSLYAGDFVSLSDIRLKKDIAPLTDALEKVCRLQGLRYRFDGAKVDPAAENIQDDPREHLGFSAQAVAEVVPEVVHYSERFDRYGVSYASLVPLLVEALKEQMDMIEAQQSRLDAQQATIDAMRADIQALKTLRSP